MTIYKYYFVTYFFYFVTLCDNHDCEAVHTKVEWCLVLYVFITLFYSIASLLSQQWSEYKLFEITNSDNLKVIFLKQEYAFSFALNKVFVAARKHNTKRNKTGFIMCVCESPPLNSLVKKNRRYVLLRQFKNIKQNIRKKNCSVGFMKPALKYCAPN